MPNFFRIKGETRHILHAEGCCHLAAAAPEDIFPARNFLHLFAHGYDVCADNNPMAKMLAAEEDGIRAFSREHHFKYKLHNKYIQIETPKGRWGIVPISSSPGTTLYHESTRPPYWENAFLPGYHFQEISYESLLSYFQYILHHDGGADYMPPPYSREPKNAPEPPRKGTKRYRSMIQQEKRQAKRRSEQAVYDLIDSLQREGASAKESKAPQAGDRRDCSQPQADAAERGTAL